MNRASFGDVAAAFFVLVLIFVLVRPRSRAAAAVKAFSDAMAAMVKAATDL